MGCRLYLQCLAVSTRRAGAVVVNETRVLRAAAPGEPPFVKEGDSVSAGETVCIIEAMKLMNEIEAEISGEVVKILVQNGQSITAGQALMIVKTV